MKYHRYGQQPFEKHEKRPAKHFSFTSENFRTGQRRQGVDVKKRISQQKEPRQSVGPAENIAASPVLPQTLQIKEIEAGKVVFDIIHLHTLALFTHGND